MTYIDRVDTPCGLWEITATDTAVCSVTNKLSAKTIRSNGVCEAAKKQLTEYFVGKRQTFTLLLDLKGTLFQKQVWDALTGIPYGKSVSYTQIAEQIGRPAAVRAVAQAISKNPCLILVPCHRVLGKNGTLTGFSAGLDIKIELLKLEKINWKE